MKLVVISIDALDSNELKENLDNLPTLKKFLKKATLIDNVKGVYPSCTYPSHTSMITGKEPYVHGIHSNTKVDPFNNEVLWNWHYSNIKVETIFDLIKQKNYTCSTVFWPVTAGLDISYCVPEIWKHNNKSTLHHILNNGNKKFIINSIFKSLCTFYKFSRNSDHNIDKFTTDAFINALKKDVDVAFLHLLELDSTKHKNGLNNIHTKNALKSIDEKLEQIFKHIPSGTNIILLGDHSHFDTSKFIDLNSLLTEHGYINYDKKSYSAYVHSNDGSAELYVNSTDEFNVLELFKNIEGIKEIKKAPSLAKFKYYIEAEKGYYFGNNFNKKSHSQHGYNPEQENYQTVTMFMGPDFEGYDTKYHTTIKDNYKLFKKGLDV